MKVFLPRVLAASGLVLGLAALVWLVSRPPEAGQPEPLDGTGVGAGPLAAAPLRAPVPPPAPEEPEVLTNQKVPIPLHKTSSLPPGTYVPIDELPEVDRGLELGDGTIVPYLNGMTWAPAIRRSSEYGPVPPVIGKTVDADGFEWYVHADGSTTTTRYQKVELPGETYWDPYTAHSVPTPKTYQRAADPDR